jgi:outer membrane receptor protein involved in Fe transport
VLLIVFFALVSTSPPLNAQVAEEQPAEEQPVEEQVADELSDDELDELIAQSEKRFTGELTVTAQKKEQTVLEVPISIKPLPAEVLEETNANDLADIARMVPSMSTTDISRGNNNVQIRGLGSNVASVGTVALFNDGVISASRSQTDGTFAEQDSSLYDVERVEILRGPQGTLYGEGSFGGVINVISKRPDPTKFDTSFMGDWFSIDEGTSSNYNVAAMVNVPLVKNKLALRVVGHLTDRDGYVDAVNVLPPFVGLGPAEFISEDANTEKFYGGRVMLGYTGEKVFGTLILKTQKTELGISNFTSPTTIELVNDYSGSSFDTDLTQAIFSPTYGSESTVNEAVLDFNIVTPIGLFTSLTGFGGVEAENFSNGMSAENDAFSQEFRLSSENAGALNYTVGAFYRSVERTIDLEGGVPYAETSMDQWSVFGQLYWDISETISATLGMRYGQFETKLTDLLIGLAPTAHDFDDVSPKIALNWQPDERTNLYVSVARGFRAGGANIDESFGTDPDFVEGFDADSIWNYEIGLKKSFWDGRMALSSALFYIDWSDIQVDRAIGSLVSPPYQYIVTNGQGAHSLGIEADIYFNPGKGWDITLGGSVMEPEFDNGTIDSTWGRFELDGMKLPNAPEVLANASVNKTFPIGGAGTQAFARIDYSYRGNSFADVPNEPPGTDFNSGSFNLLNLRAGVTFKNWEYQIYAKNLTNQDATAFNWDDGLYHFRARIAPITIGTSFRYHFN